MYRDTFHGTLRSEMERIWQKGKHIIFDIDVEGGLHLKKKYGSRALAIFVQPPSFDVLVDRLTSRGTDKPEKLAERIGKAKKELTYANKFDVILNNDELDTACMEVEQLVARFLAKDAI